MIENMKITLSYEQNKDIIVKKIDIENKPIPCIGEELVYEGEFFKIINRIISFDDSVDYDIYLDAKILF